MPSNRFSEFSHGVNAPAIGSHVITPSDSADLPEVIRAVISRSRLIWDSVLDWTGVMIGAAAVNYLMVGQAIPAIALVISALIIAIIGADRRTEGLQ